MGRNLETGAVAMALAPVRAVADASERDPRLRIVLLLMFAIAVVGMDETSALLASVGVGAFLTAMLPISRQRLMKRLLAIEGLLAMVLITVPFTVPGNAVLEFGPLVASAEGLAASLKIFLKATAVALMAIALVSTMNGSVLVHGLAGLGLPATLVHLFVLSSRYVDVLGQEATRLRLAMVARGFRARVDMHSARNLGNLVGMVLVRGLDRGHRVYQAMLCRGYNGRLPPVPARPLDRCDALFAAAFAMVLSVLVVLGYG